MRQRIATYRQSEKKLVKQHNIVNFGALTAEIGSRVWGTPGNFNGFRVLAALLQRSRSPKAKQTLHYVWPSPGLLYYIYIFGGSCPLTEFYPVQNLFYVQVLRSGILAALLHDTLAVGVSQAAALKRGLHLYSAGRPSRCPHF